MISSKTLPVLVGAVLIASGTLASAADSLRDTARPLTMQSAYNGLQEMPEGSEAADFAAWLERAQARRGGNVQLVVQAYSLDEAVRQSEWRRRVATRLAWLFD